MEEERWSALPLDLAILVVRLLPTYADRARFASVCPQWRTAARQLLPTPLPLLALPDGTFYNIPYTKPFRFPGCGVAGYQSACGKWLVFPCDDGCFLVDPFSRDDTVTLPALSCVRLVPPNAVAKWRNMGRLEFPDPYTTWMHIRGSEKLHITKLILCSPNLVAALVGIGHVSQVLMCQPGASAWSVRAYDQCKGFEDMAFYQGKLYAIAKDENLLVVNISEEHSTRDPQVSNIERVIKGDPWYPALFQGNTMHHKKLYLVESCGVLLMVRRAIRCQVTEGKVVAGQSVFEVFEADFEHSRWVKALTLGEDQVLFLGRKCSRSMSVSEYGFYGNLIFFLDDDEQNRMEYCYNEEDTSFSVYDMRSGTARTAYPKISWKRCDEMRLAAWLFPQD